MKEVPALLRLVCLILMLATAGPAMAAGPLKIGFSLALTGGLASGGRQILAAIELWRDDINARGGLLGRPVVLDFYDDQSNPANVPAIYTKIIEVDKADLVVGPYGTPLVAPAIPIVMRHDMVTIGILALAANAHFHYSKFFDMLPVGQTPKRALSAGFFAVAAQAAPKPRTLAIIAADSEFSKNTADGARANAKAAGFEIVYDKSYPASLGDFGPILRAVKAIGPDILYVAAYPPDTVGIVRAASEIGMTPKIFGGNMNRSYDHALEDSTRAVAQPHRQHGYLSARAELQFSGGCGRAETLPGARGAGRPRPVGLRLRPLRLCRDAGARRGGRPNQQPRCRQTRSLYRGPPLCDRCGRDRLRQERRMEAVPDHHDAVSACRKPLA